MARHQKTVVDRLRSACAQVPDKIGVRVIDGDTVQEITYAQLEARSLRLAAYLQGRGLEGQRALIVGNTSIEYLVHFFACLYAGVIAVPAVPVVRSRRTGTLERLQSMAVDAGARIVLATEDDRRDPVLDGLEWLNERDAQGADPATWRAPEIGPDSPAFLQYTSGSTTRPRGVVLSNANLLAQSELLEDFCPPGPGDSAVSWLPLYHDMGLIAFAIHPLLLKGTTNLMPPATFVRRPVRWLETISRNRSRYIGSSNFGCEYCASRVTEEQKAGLDLSCVDVAFIGADLVREDSLRRFEEALRPCGFNGNVMVPCYGLAEATLAVTCTPFKRGRISRNVNPVKLAAGVVEEGAGKDTRCVMSCGAPVPGHHVRIVEPETGKAVADGSVGEIWAAGPCVAKGYWNNPEESTRVFGARVTGGDETPYLRTGDLGFMADGELYVVGRIKDLIIIRGRNHFSQDIEATIHAVDPNFGSDNTVAIGVEVAGDERLVVLIEADSKLRAAVDASAREIQKAVLDTHGVAIHEILAVKPRSLPHTTSGKLQRNACREAYTNGSLPIVQRWTAIEKSAADLPDVEAGDRLGRATMLLIDVVTRTLNLPRNSVHAGTEWISLGLDSLKAVQIAGEMGAATGVTVEPASLLDLETVGEVAAHLARRFGAAIDTALSTNSARTDIEQAPGTKPALLPSVASVHDIAIIGMACRLPGASTPDEFWRNLRTARCATSETPPDRWDWRAFADRQGAPGAHRGAFLADVDAFDAEFFGISDKDAVLLDPQQRLFLEVLWEAIERSGYKPAKLAGSRTGLFVGASTQDYAELLRSAGGPSTSAAIAGNSLAFLANRASYFFDFHGPSLTIDTACSSSLVALHLAVQSLRRGECSAAIAGGVNLTLSPEKSIMFGSAGLIAADGVCRAFDDRAAGYVRGEAVAAVVLKPLQAAIADGDEIFGVVKGSSVTHDGNHKIGLTSPSPKGQRRVVLEAHRDAAVGAETIGYVEAHGTGTLLGDGIELQGMRRAFEESTSKKAYCALGSVKTRVGHAEAASGISSVIAAILALRHGEIPPNLNLASPSRQTVVEDSPFYLNERLRAWPSKGFPRRAAVNSVGLGGVCAHVILEEAPEYTPTHGPVDNEPFVLALSARSEKALDRLRAAYADALNNTHPERFQDFCATANRGRTVFAHRCAIVAKSGEALKTALGSNAHPCNETGAIVLRGSAPLDLSHDFDEIVELLNALSESGRNRVFAGWHDPDAEAVVRPKLRPAHALAPPTDKSDKERFAIAVCLAALFAHGADVTWDNVYNGQLRVASLLPTYPFERRRYWPCAANTQSVEAPAEQKAQHTNGRAGALECWLVEQLVNAAPAVVSRVSPTANFMDLGIDSVAVTRFAFLLEQKLGARIPLTVFFEHPNIRALARYLTPMVKSIPASGGMNLNEATSLQPAGEPFESTPLQQAYLMARGLRPEWGGGGSQVAMDIEVSGELNRDRLQESLRQLIHRHAMLRTVFLRDGRQQMLGETPDYNIQFFDLRSLDDNDAEARCAELYQSLADSVFDPYSWPLFSAVAIQRKPGSFHLLFAIDLLLIDFRSLSILLREWRDLYTGADAKPSPLPVDFGGYMKALHSLRASARLESDKQWWKSRVENFPRAPAICRTGPSRRHTAGAFRTLDFALSAETWEQAGAQASRHGVSTAMMLCGAFCRTLRLWSGADNFCLNIPVFDRYPVHPAIDSVVGPFNNNILLAIAWPDHADLWDNVRALQRNCIEALEHRLFTGVEFAREIAQHRKSLTDPIGPVVFTPAIHGADRERWGRIRRVTSQTPQVWLDCQVVESSDGATIRWDFDPARFDTHTVEEMFAHFRGSIAAMITGVTSESATGPCKGPTLDSLVHEQAMRTPQLRAVACNGRYKTYAGLDQRANQIANALVARGAAPGSLVAIAAERSIEMVEAVLGVLKAGCAYVPIDPEYPAQRIQYLIEHCQASIVLTQAHLADTLPASNRVILDIAGVEVDAMPTTAPDRPRSPDDLAYVIYTSGSTGKPKGVMITHAAAINTIEDINRRFRVSKFDRVLGFSSLSFDLSVYDIFGALSAGATLVVLPRESLKSPDRWIELIDREGVTIWNSVPTGMKMLLDYCEGRRVSRAPTLRLVMLSGDWIPLELPARVKAHFGDPEVISLGGATEASIWSIFYPVSDVRPEWKSIPYGAPLANQTWHIFEDDLRPVPHGETGELCIGGKGVALGYYRDPERTARSFVRHPDTGEIIYRTGDLGRMMDDGNIEIVGRRDLQVKIRGYRVELAEIEAALNGHPGVDSGVVTVRGERGKHELAAHFVPRNHAMTVADLRSHLRSVLPEYMVPQHFIQHHSLPLNANGKIDRGALDAAVT